MVMTERMVLPHRSEVSVCSIVPIGPHFLALARLRAWNNSPWSKRCSLYPATHRQWIASS
jgi:hypothetical protein